MDSSLMMPLMSTPAPRRGAAFISSMTRIRPSGETSAMICRIEFDPMSMAERRTVSLSRLVFRGERETRGGAVIPSGGVPAGRIVGGPRVELEPMLDRFPLGEKYGVLPDIGGEVRHTLEVAAHEQKLERGVDRACI